MDQLIGKARCSLKSNTRINGEIDPKRVNSDHDAPEYEALKQTRLDIRLPQLRAGGQGAYLRSAKHLSSKAKKRRNAKIVKCDGHGPTNGPTDGRTKRGVESRARD